jgi:hypothetical protein
MITMMVANLEGEDKMRPITLKDKRTSTTMVDECNENKGTKGYERTNNTRWFMSSTYLVALYRER